MRESKLFRCLYVLCLIILISSGTALLIRSAELRRGNAFYRQTEEKSLPVKASTPQAAPADRPAAPEGQESEPAPPACSRVFSEFAGKYPDAAIWLQLPDTSLDYPVMRGKDNQFYLNHLPDGSKNALGSLFLDYRTTEDSVHLIVYGHNGVGGKMFGLLKQYESQDYFSAHKTLTVATADAAYSCPIFSVRRVEADSDAYQLEFEGEDGLQSYIQEASAESLYRIDAALENAVGVLTLSTCTGWQNQRLIVQAILPIA